MRSLRTILAYAVPTVTALFGIFWLFNKKKPPPSKQITEPPDKEKEAADRKLIDSREKNESKGGKEVVDEVAVNEAVKLEKLAALGCGDVIANVSEEQVVNDKQNVNKQNEDDEIISEIDNAFKDIYEGSDVEDEMIESKHVSVVESAIEPVFKDGLNTVSDATRQSDDVISDIEQDKIITRQRVDDLNLSSAANTTQTQLERNSDVVKDEVGLQDEAILAASAVNLNVAPVPSIDKESAILKSENIEDLVISSVDQSIVNAGLSKNAEEIVSPEQNESKIESQIITEQFVSQKSQPVNASSHTSQLTETSPNLDNNSESLQTETNSNDVKCDSKTDKVSNDNAKAVTSGVSLEQNESSEVSDWVSDQNKTNSWDEEISNTNQTKSSSWEEETAKELGSDIQTNAWVVNGEIEDTKPKQQPTAKGKVISGSNASGAAPRRSPGKSSAPGAYVSREKRGGSLNSSESSSNCDNSSVVCIACLKVLACWGSAVTKW